MGKIIKRYKNNFVSVICFIIIIVFFVLNFIDIYIWHIDWEKFKNIQFFSEIVCSITIFVGSIIGIAIPLQKDKIYGVSPQDIYKMRYNFNYSIRTIILMLIILALLNGLFIVFDMYFLCCGITLVSVIFCIYIIFQEVPIMMRDEKSLIKILDEYIYHIITNSKRLTNDVIEILKYMSCYEKTLIETYEMFKKDNFNYNEKLIINLLEIQKQQASEIERIENLDLQGQIVSNLLENIKDILYFNINLPNIIKETTSYSHYINKILFKINNIPKYSKDSCDLVVKIIDRSNFVEDKDQINFIISVILPLIFSTITSENFTIANAILRLLSERKLIIGNYKFLSLILSIMSLHFFYLCNGAPNASNDLKHKIIDFMSFDGVVDSTRIFPWKQIFFEHINNFNIEFKELLNCYYLSENSWDVIIRNAGAYYVEHSEEYVLQWYLSCLFYSDFAFNFDFNNLKIDDNINIILKSLGDKILNSNEKPALTDLMNKMVVFFELNTNYILYFNIEDNRNCSFINLINSLHLQDLEKKQEDVKKYNVEEKVKNYGDLIIKDLCGEWGYNPQLELDGKSNFLKLTIYKLFNQDKLIVDCILNATYLELLNNTPKNIIYKDEHFDATIDNFISKKINAITINLNRKLPYIIPNLEIRRQLNSSLFDFKIIRSNIFNGDYFFMDNSFSFNFKIEYIGGRQLNNEEISNESNKFKRADGQYIYKGLLVNREKLEECIKEQYYILELELKYVINVSNDNIYKIVFLKNIR